MSVQLLLGDCLDVMRGMPDGCVDAVVCDPPYGLGFMGKEWDSPGKSFFERKAKRSTTFDHVGGNHNPSNAKDAVRTAARENALFQEWATEWATEALRVAKPGAHILAFGGTRTFHRLACAIEDAGWQIKDCLSWLYGSGFPKHKTLLKPAWEPVVMAVKAGSRVVNIEECRITGRIEGAQYRSDGNGRRHMLGESEAGKSYRVESHHLGRWPANVCLDEEAAAMLDEQSGTLQSGFMRAGTTRSTRSTRSVCYGDMPADAVKRDTIADKGGASRFFYVAKASRSEREAGLREAPRSTMGDGIGGQPLQSIASRNHHPTVKPVALMRWLVRLVTPPDGVALDPFMGSGTTGIACVREGRSFVGIEREPEYHAIAEARIAHARGEAPSNAAQPALPFEVSA